MAIYKQSPFIWWVKTVKNNLHRTFHCFFISFLVQQPHPISRTQTRELHTLPSPLTKAQWHWLTVSWFSPRVKCDSHAVSRWVSSRHSPVNMCWTTSSRNVVSSNFLSLLNFSCTKWKWPIFQETLLTWALSLSARESFRCGWQVWHLQNNNVSKKYHFLLN